MSRSTTSALIADFGRRVLLRLEGRFYELTQEELRRLLGLPAGPPGLGITIDHGRAHFDFAIEAKTLYSGLMQLKGVSDRWPDVPAAREVRAIFEEYDSRPERPWEADDIAEQRRTLVARARSLDSYASGPMPKQYQAQHADMLRAAIGLWQQVIADGEDREAVAKARERIPKLEMLLGKVGKKE